MPARLKKCGKDSTYWLKAQHRSKEARNTSTRGKTTPCYTASPTTVQPTTV
ncbi:MAG: hypothetical protein ACTSXW_02365 [Candidatus Baldrarchaeia archaeon]